MNAKKFNMVLIGALLLVIVAGGAAYYFTSQNLKAGTASLSRSLADQKLADQQLDAMMDLKLQYQRLQPLVPLIDNALPKEKNQSQIAVQLRNIALASGMNLDSLSFTSSSAPGPVSQTIPVGDVLAIPVTFHLTGTYNQLQQFLVKQEHLPRYTSMTSLGITSATGGKLNFDVTLNVFLKP